MFAQIKKKRKLEKGFVLVELVIAIIVVAVLSGVAVPAYFTLTGRARAAADTQNASVLNSATMNYAALEDKNTSDIFQGIATDNARMQALVSGGYLKQIIPAVQQNASFKWDIQGQLWYVSVNDSPPPLTPLGSTFQEISAGMLKKIVDHYNLTGYYGRTWGDYRYTDIGLVPSDWTAPVNHIIYTPKGSSFTIKPEDGYTFFVNRLNGQTIKMKSTYNYYLIYDVLTQKWYYYSIDAANAIDINTLKVEATK
jgi:prepilin-type N-terminal cleavage/methylation domain-containing protein